jgi:hypothetical protein
MGIVAEMAGCSNGKFGKCSGKATGVAGLAVIRAAGGEIGA